MKIVVVLGVFATLTASANTWGVLEVQSRNVDPGDAQTYRELLQAELGRQLSTGGVVTLIAGSCSDPGCAAQKGQAAGVDYAVMLTLGTLGSKLITTAAVVESKTGVSLRNEKMTIDRIEDLESVASRMALAFASNKPMADSAELGNITEVERTPPKRREGDSGVSLHLKGLIPFGTALADVPVGMGFDLGFWYEAPAFSIEPRIGVRFDAKSDDRAFYMVPIDINAHYIFGLGDFTPFIGGGFGARWVAEEFKATVTTTSPGGLIQTSNETVFEDDGWGFGLVGRVGVLLFRTYTVRMTIAVEYDITFVSLNDRDFPQTFQFSVGVVF